MNRFLQRSIISFISVSSVANAGEDIQGKRNFEGFYLGGALGYLSSNSQVERIQVQGNRKAGFKMSNQAPQISVFFGYGGFLWSSLYAGLEGKVTYTNYKGKYTHDHTLARSLEHHLKSSYGLAGRVGWKVKDIALPYLKVGVVSSAMRLKAQEPAELHDDSKKNLRGFEIGLGVDFSVSPHLLLGAEFTHTRYQSIHASVPRFVHYKVQPQINVFTLRAAWKF